MAKTENHDYTIGYGKPPESGQFRPGRSGNPKGRPRGSENLASVVLSEGRQLVKINGPNGPRYITKMRAGLRQLANKSAQGDLAAIREMTSLTRSFKDPGISLGVNEVIPERDRAVLASMLHRIREADPKAKSKPHNKKGQAK